MCWLYRYSQNCTPVSSCITSLGEAVVGGGAVVGDGCGASVVCLAVVPGVVEGSGVVGEGVGSGVPGEVVPESKASVVVEPS